MACLGVALAGLGYTIASASFNSDEVVGPAIFWFAAIFFLFSVPFRDAARWFAVTIRTSLGCAAFVSYLAVHLLLYGFVFDAVLALVYGAGHFSTGAGLQVTTNLFSPPSLAGLASDITYNPIIFIAVPPIFSTALSFYSISVALMIAVLIVANIGMTRELGALTRAAGRARVFVALPALGIVLGASCCLSVAGLISLAGPAETFLASNPWIYYLTYFLFPCIAIVILYLNLRSVERISSAVAAS